MMGMLRTWLSSAERDRRIISSVLGDEQLAQMDAENAEVDALLCRRRPEAKANTLLRSVRAKVKAKMLLRRLANRSVESAKQKPSTQGIIRKTYFNR
ncbi:hypothetical protein XI06_14220 [Bradyrhizobium sp. CCBAU 11434]|uniref:hypothetical protein n=1 Tax=Bradyrhizobium sp. CCBAU 11434 TaxID=1630885 RepID=UPI002305BC31|nr:hypothetical protein [Bradyrhizobium sp. CCBAU 11434]MDA9521475.1 hypothetical protein [Bradyrhizobium sp. CCBAU 11434]